MAIRTPAQQHPLAAILSLFIALSLFLTYRSLVVGNAPEADVNKAELIFLPPDLWQRQELQASHVVTIPYAISVTSCDKRDLVVGGAAVLQHSIHLNSIRTPSSGSRYDYEMVAFVHPDAVECTDILDALNYKVLIKQEPFQTDQIRGEYWRWANRTGCCGVKEWLKLYSYTLTQYPVVVHLDLDCVVLKPLDDLFDAMIVTTTPRDSTVKDIASTRSRIPAMWVNTTDLPETIDFFFTRDYGMVQDLGKRPVHKMGVQGGFLVLRPNRTVFQEFIDIILEGNYTEARGWGGKLGYGGYYGAGTIQGLASMYYGHLHPERAVELNRCLYNNMADSPYPKKYAKPEFFNETPYPCLTLQDTCEDCRETHFKDIFSIHLTNCFKPWKCVAPSAVHPVCGQHFYEWYRMRYLVEAKWRGREIHVPRISVGSGTTIQNISFGFCRGHGPESYRPIELTIKSSNVESN